MEYLIGALIAVLLMGRSRPQGGGRQPPNPPPPPEPADRPPSPWGKW